MFKITNNNQVYLSRGETATYVRSVRQSDKYSSPYILPAGLIEPRIKLSIKSNKNDKKDILTYEGIIGDEVPRFVSKIILDVTDIPAKPQENVLYRLYNSETDKYTYSYYRDGSWRNYNFVIRIEIPASDTADLRPATYYYDLSLITRDRNGDIEYKEVWIQPTEFIIGGSF